MGLRFWRRFKVAPGVTLNLSKSGGSLSFGPRGAKVTVGSRGKRTTMGIPGTGIFYTSTFRDKGSASHKRSQSPVSSVKLKDRLTPGFFKRLLMADNEKAFVDGCRELVLGSEQQAFEHLRRASHLADGAYLAGFLAFKRQLLPEAAEYLKTACRKQNRLGHYFSKYGMAATVSLAITSHVSVHVCPDIRGVMLILAEVYQMMACRQDAIACLEKLHKRDPSDIVIKLSFAELLLDEDVPDPNNCRRALKLASETENRSALHAALMLYKARALRHLGLYAAARDTLTQTLRRKKDRPSDLLQALSYERALVYEQMGQTTRARTAIENLYAADPDFEDEAGLGQRLIGSGR